MTTTRIDWTATQKALAAAGWPIGVSGPNRDGIDGSPGGLTYAGLFAACGSRQASPVVLRSIGVAAAVQLPAFGVADTVERLADFIAQTGDETGGYTTFEENLRYSALRLTQVWPSRFPTIASAQPYAWSPSNPHADVALGDKVYGDRMGNQLNGLNDDDGWNSRGKGMLMLTGLANLAASDSRLHLGLVANPELAVDPATSVEIAADFYRANGVLAAIDAGDLSGARKIVNVGNRYSPTPPVGWADVQARRQTALSFVKG